MTTVGYSTRCAPLLDQAVRAVPAADGTQPLADARLPLLGVEDHEVLPQPRFEVGEGRDRAAGRPPCRGAGSDGRRSPAPSPRSTAPSRRRRPPRGSRRAPPPPRAARPANGSAGQREASLAVVDPGVPAHALGERQRAQPRGERPREHLPGRAARDSADEEEVASAPAGPWQPAGASSGGTPHFFAKPSAALVQRPSASFATFSAGPQTCSSLSAWRATTSATTTSRRGVEKDRTSSRLQLVPRASSAKRWRTARSAPAARPPASPRSRPPGGAQAPAATGALAGLPRRRNVGRRNGAGQLPDPQDHPCRWLTEIAPRASRTLKAWDDLRHQS